MVHFRDSIAWLVRVFLGVYHRARIRLPLLPQPRAIVADTTLYLRERLAGAFAIEYRSSYRTSSQAIPLSPTDPYA
jgi:hypothetical protein